MKLPLLHLPTNRMSLLGLCIGTSFALTSCGGEELPDESPEVVTTTAEKPMFSIEEAFEIVAKQNDVARKLYTKGIVGPGKKSGLAFDENWKDDAVEAGPLPALFLRGISSDIQKSPVPLGLYLGSDFPINSANKFTGKQAELFAEMRKDASAKFFVEEEEGTTTQTAMFPDFAAAQACVTCHNEHPETSKTDWKLGDIMGATTWTYPKDSVTFSELKDMVMSYRNGAIVTYNSFLDEVRAFKEKEVPEIGDKWPSEDCYCVPTAEVYLDSVLDLSSKNTLAGFLK